jgi:purine-binding chemotaxis protein CheW
MSKNPRSHKSGRSFFLIIADKALKRVNAGGYSVERPSRRTAAEGKYLSFRLSGETYAVPIKSVSEIVGLTDITHVPNLPDYMRGIINLRGKVLPVMDMRRKFSLPVAEYHRETCVIIVDIWTKKIGLIVDTVREVLDFKLNNIEGAPEIGGQNHTQCLIGIGKLPDKVVILVEPSLILSPEDLTGSVSFASVASVA